MLEFWLLPWRTGAKFLPGVLGVALKPGGGIAGCSCCASLCQGLLGAPVPLQPAGKGATPPGEAGEQPGWMLSLGRALPGMYHECESVCTALLMFVSTAKPAGIPRVLCCFR